MRTGHSLTVCWSLLPGGVSPPGGQVSGLGGGGCLLWGVGVSALGGLLPGGHVCSGEVSAPWGAGCLLQGEGRYPSMHWGRLHPPPPVDRQTPVKILSWPNFVAAGNNWKFLKEQWAHILYDIQHYVWVIWGWLWTNLYWMNTRHLISLNRVKG